MLVVIVNEVQRLPDVIVKPFAIRVVMLVPRLPMLVDGFGPSESRVLFPNIRRLLQMPGLANALPLSCGRPSAADRQLQRLVGPPSLQ